MLSFEELTKDQRREIHEFIREKYREQLNSETKGTAIGVQFVGNSKFDFFHLRAFYDLFQQKQKTETMGGTRLLPLHNGQGEQGHQLCSGHCRADVEVGIFFKNPKPPPRIALSF